MQRFHFVVLRFGCVLLLKTSRAFELTDYWIEGAIRMMGRAEIAQAGMRLATQPRQRGPGKRMCPPLRLVVSPTARR
jgi:hypothetical protein